MGIWPPSLGMILLLGLLVAWKPGYVPAQPPPAKDGPKGLSPLRDGSRPPRAGNRWALLIGINQYEHIGKLSYCAQDMAILAEKLILFGGYQPGCVRVLIDEVPEGWNPTRSSTLVRWRPDRGNIIIQLDRLLQEVKPEDTLLLAFSGHGKHDDKTGYTYLMPIEGIFNNLKWTAIPLDDLFREYLEKCKARQKIVIIDACHSGGRAGRGHDPGVGLDPSQIPAAQGMIELYSCKAEEESWEDSKLEQGVFSHFLAQAIEGAADREEAGNGDGYVTANEIYEYTQARVTQYVKGRFPKSQTPTMRGQVEGGTMILAARARGPGNSIPRTSPIDSTSCKEISSRRIWSLTPSAGSICPRPSPRRRDAFVAVADGTAEDPTAPVPAPGARSGPAAPLTHSRRAGSRQATDPSADRGIQPQCVRRSAGTAAGHVRREAVA